MQSKYKKVHKDQQKSAKVAIPNKYTIDIMNKWLQ